MSRKDAIVSVILVALIFFIFLGFVKNFRKYSAIASVSIITHKNEYNNGDNLKVKIINNSGKNVCFSTCYPYQLEKKDKTWQSYKYVECDHDNIHNGCINNRQVKAFELTLPKSITGLHRLAIPVCSTCEEGKLFKEESVFYSNEFIIK